MKCGGDRGECKLDKNVGYFKYISAYTQDSQEETNSQWVALAGRTMVVIIFFYFSVFKNVLTGDRW